MNDLQQQQHAHDVERILLDLFGTADVSVISVALSHMYESQAEARFAEMTTLIARIEPSEIGKYLDVMRAQLNAVGTLLEKAHRAREAR